MSSVSVKSVSAYQGGSGPDPPSPDGGGSDSSSSVPIGAIVGGVVGGLVAVAVVAGMFLYWKRRGRGPSSPKAPGAMEQGRLGGLSGKDGTGGVDVAARTGAHLQLARSPGLS